jgi:hypothetical protein
LCENQNFNLWFSRYYYFVIITEYFELVTDSNNLSIYFENHSFSFVVGASCSLVVVAGFESRATPGFKLLQVSKWTRFTSKNHPQKRYETPSKNNLQLTTDQ